MPSFYPLVMAQRFQELTLLFFKFYSHMCTAVAQKAHATCKAVKRYL